MHRRNKKANQFLYSSCFQKGTSFVLYFCLARFTFFLSLMKIKEEEKEIKKACAHTERAVDGEGGKKTEITT